MSKRNLIICTLVLGVVAVLIQFLSNSGNRNEDPLVGSPLADQNLIESIDEIVIQDFKAAVHFQKKGDQWLIVEKDNYPVDIKQLIELLDKIVTIKVASLVTGDPNRLAHFRLLYKDDAKSNETSTGTQLILNGGGKEVFRILTGKSRDSVRSTPNSPPRPDGTYIRIGKTQKVYLIKENLDLDIDTENWLQKTLVVLEKALIKAIRYETQNARFVVERESKDKELKMMELGENEKTSDYELSGVLTELKSFSIEQVVRRTPELENGLELKSAISVEMFDKSFFDFQLFSKTVKDPLKKEKDKVTFYIKILPSSLEISQQKWRSVYGLAEKWLFVVEEWQAKKWMKAKKDFVVPITHE